MNAPARIYETSSPVHPDAALQVSGKPHDIAVLVLPGFSHLALHAYIEPFRIANTVSRLPLFRWRIAGIDGQAVVGANGLSIPVDVTVEELAAGRSYNCRLNQLAVVAGEPVERQLTPQLNAFLRLMAQARGIDIGDRHGDVAARSDGPARGYPLHHSLVTARGFL